MHITMIIPTGEIYPANFRWTKPLVTIIGLKTRNELEIMAYSLKKTEVSLVGFNTNGAVIDGRAFIFEDGSFC